MCKNSIGYIIHGVHSGRYSFQKEIQLMLVSMNVGQYECRLEQINFFCDPPKLQIDFQEFEQRVVMTLSIVDQQGKLLWTLLWQEYHGNSQRQTFFALLPDPFVVVQWQYSQLVMYGHWKKKKKQSDLKMLPWACVKIALVILYMEFILVDIAFKRRYS